MSLFAALAPLYQRVARGTPLAGPRRVPGVHREVEILWTEGSIPHLYAHSEEDLFFAQGYLTASERLFQMDFLRRAAAGRLAEIFGARPLGWRDLTIHLKNKTVVDLDHMLRIVGLARWAKESLQSTSERGRRALERYAQGVNARLSEGRLPPEFLLLGYAPEAWAPQDSYLVEKALALELNVTWRTVLGYETLHHQLDDPARAASLLPAYPRDAPRIVEELPAGLAALAGATSGALGVGGPHAGSNNWVVSGKKSKSGKPILCNDPHLQLTAPAAFYVAHLSGGELDVAGATLPGVPGVILGHNREVAWGATAAFAHDTDLFAEKIEGQSYLRAGKLVPLELRDEVIVVKGQAPVRRQIRSTVHGPLLTDVLGQRSGAALSFCWTAHSASGEIDALLGMNLARSGEELRAALKVHVAPALNFVWASRDGKIGYLLAGSYPMRRKPTYLSRDGTDPANDWTGTVPYDQLPRLDDPPAGMIATANNRIAPGGYPHYLADLYEPPYRVQRILQLLGATERLDADDMARIQADVKSLWAERLIGSVLKALAATELPMTGRARAALQRMLAWDCVSTRDSTEAALFYAYYQSLIERLFGGLLGDDAWHAYFEVLNSSVVPVENLLVGDNPFLTAAAREEIALRALEDCLEDLRRKLGDDDAKWRWGRLHHLHLRHRLHDAKPLRPLLSPGPWETGGDGMTVNNGQFWFANPAEHMVGPAYRQIFDLADWDQARVVLAGGQGGNPFSKRYTDHMERWLAGKHFTLPFTRRAVEKAAEGEAVKLLPFA